MEGDMKETRKEVEAKLAERKQRLEDLETRGAEAMSRYDIEIAAGGDADQAVRTALYLIGNHISYYSRQLEEMPPEQGKLF
jgi:SMC interacting uncharacterized protein involved in chromosome segregation